MKSLLVGLAIIFCLLMSNIANAQSTLALQEKCAEGAKKFFFEKYGDGNLVDAAGGFWPSRFTTHYNKKFDKCFILVKTSYVPKGKPYQLFIMVSLVDVYEGKEYGSFNCSGFPKPGGRVGDKFCDSEAECEALIKPYMEE